MQVLRLAPGSVQLHSEVIGFGFSQADEPQELQQPANVKVEMESNIAPDKINNAVFIRIPPRVFLAV